MIVIIAAVARNGVIGKGNQLPWHLPEDLRHFRALTMGHAVVMGRKTWESLPERFRPLPGRTNIVVTRDPEYKAEGATVVHSLAAVQKVDARGTAPDGSAANMGTAAATLFVIGGAELYAHALPLADRLELTEIDADFEGDVYFPAHDRQQWQEAGREAGVSAAGLRYAFVTYARTQST